MSPSHGCAALPLVHVLLLQDLVRGAVHAVVVVLILGVVVVVAVASLGPGLAQRFDPRAGPGVHHVVPVARGTRGQLEEPLDEEHARVADLAGALLHEVKAFQEDRLVLFAVGEAGAERKNKTSANRCKFGML